MTSHFHTRAPAVTLTGALPTLIGTANLLVSSVNLSAGEEPGIAVVSVPGLHPYNIPDPAGTDCSIALAGNVLFHGWIVEAQYGEDANDYQCDLTLADARIFLGGAVIGEDTGPDWNAVGANVIFNEGGIPDHDGRGGWAKRTDNAVYWTVKDILLKLNDYVEWASDLTMDLDDWTKDNNLKTPLLSYPGEVKIAGQNVAQALSHVLRFLGTETWGLDYDAGKIHRISMSEPGPALALRHMTADGDVTTATAPSWTVSHSGRRSITRVAVVSEPQRLEHTWSLGENSLRRATGFESPDFAVKLETDPAFYAAHPDRFGVAGNRGLPWLRQLITRRKLDAKGYLTAAEVAAHPGSGTPLSDKECVWILARTDEEDASGDRKPGHWLKLIGGYEVEYDPPAVLLEPTLKAYGFPGAGPTPQGYEEDADNEPTPPDPPQEQDIVSDDILDLLITTVTECTLVDIREATDAKLIGNRHLTEILHPKGIIPLRRWNVLIPNLAKVTENPAARLYIADETYLDVVPALADAAADRLHENARVYSEVVANLDVPVAVQLGQGVTWTKSGGGAMVGDPLILVGADYYLEDQYRLVLRAANQLGSDLANRRPLATKALGDWRYAAAAEKRALAFAVSQHRQTKAKEDAGDELD